jgi:hypothetical protein
MPIKQKSKAPRAANAPPIWKTGEPERALEHPDDAVVERAAPQNAGNAASTQDCQAPPAREISAAGATVDETASLESKSSPVLASDGRRSASGEVPKRGPQYGIVRMGQALRGEGIDERMVAETYAGVVGLLKEKIQENESVEKLLVDVLKECSKHLEQDSEMTGKTSVRVSLVHNVARPLRNISAPLSGHETHSATQSSEELAVGVQSL